MPSWWMPASCANALRPTMALLACTGSLGEPRQQLAGLEEQRRRRSPVVYGSRSLPHAQRHHDLFERGVAGALADAVDRALDLPHAALNRRQAVGDRQPEVVVAVRAEDRLVGVRDALADVREELADLVGHGVADRVGQVDRRRAGGDHRLDDPAQEVAIAARRILGRKLHIVGELAGAADAVDRSPRGTASRVMRSLRSRCRSEVARKVWMRRRSAGSSAARRFLDVLRPAARQRRDDRPADLAGRSGASLRSRPARRSGSRLR